ncbi:MAG: hypothetical protein F4065_06070 [Rhodothermaceae bacterium]|nr:hypothetical protein [Bacteroidota bacterium]MXX98053.1 hypothetical protein [Rhodothermaceae bacterium]MXZ58672.1 hypothetical protein [Rhodothermaceae bacterium]MYB91365.1 hypothetical protein [Rhodothermaceae bacterium]MYD68016.1 hypothetical protein [Rhodothermaceae bacterium]
MKRSSGHFLRFIDLGLLLLLAFLSVAELNPTLQVPLPGKPGSPQEVVTARVVFNQDWEGMLTRLDRSAILCKTASIVELATCMEQHAAMRYLLAPVETATVQQVVTLLDHCRRAAHPCEIEPLQP